MLPILMSFKISRLKLFLNPFKWKTHHESCIWFYEHSPNFKPATLQQKCCYVLLVEMFSRYHHHYLGQKFALYVRPNKIVNTRSLKTTSPIQNEDYNSISDPREKETSQKLSWSRIFVFVLLRLEKYTTCCFDNGFVTSQLSSVKQWVEKNCNWNGSNIKPHNIHFSLLTLTCLKLAKYILKTACW